MQFRYYQFLYYLFLGVSLPIAYSQEQEASPAQESEEEQLPVQEEVPAPEQPSMQETVPATTETEDAGVEESVSGFALPSVSEGLAEGEGHLFIIKKKGDGGPVNRVEVTHGGEKLYSDAAGQVRLRLESANKVVRLYKAGFETMTYSTEVLMSEKQTEVFLFPRLGDDEAVIIRGRRRPEVSRKRIKIKEAASVAAGGDPVKVTQLLPGVQESSSFDSRVIIRGSGPDDSIYYLDDIALPFIFHPVGGLSIIPEQLLEEVEFSSGGFGPQAGFATGGVIKLKTKQDIPEKDIWDIRFNLPIYSSIYHEKPLDEDSSVSISLRRSYLEPFVEAALEATSDGQSVSLVPFFGDVYLRYLEKEETGITKWTFFHSFDGITLAVPSGDIANDQGKFTAEIKLEFTGISAEKQTRLSSKWRYRATPYFINFNQNSDFFDNKINIGVDTLSLPVEFTYRADRKLRYYLGTELSYRRVNIDLFVPQPNRDDPFFDVEDAPKIKAKKEQDGVVASSWVSMELQTESDTTYVPGIRLQQDDSLPGKTSIDPRLNVSQKVSKDVRLKGAIGQYSDIPAFDESDADFGSEKLEFEASRHYVLGLEKDWGDLWTGEFQIFYKQLVKGVTPDSDPEVKYTNKGEGRTSGLEIFLRRNLSSRFFGWLSYTYSKNEQRDSSDGDWYNSQFDQTHILNLVGSYKISSTWEFGGRFAHTSGNTYTPVNDVYYNPNLDKYRPKSIAADKNKARLPSVTKLSIFSSHDTLYDTWKLQWRFGIEDYILGKDARNLSYNYDYSKEEFTSVVPFIPYIELRAML